MPRKKKPENNYFHEGVEQAVLDYNKSSSQDERDRLFRIIYPAIAKIAQVMYNKIKPTYVDGFSMDTQYDCIAFLTEKLHMVKEGKGKAFSYLTVTARNYYIQANMHGYRDTKKIVSLDYINENWDISDSDNGRLEEMEYKAQLLDGFKIYLKENGNSIFPSNKSRLIVNDIVDMIDSIDDISDFNHRNIMNTLYEKRKDLVDRHLVTKVTNKLTAHYVNYKKNYEKTGQIIECTEKDDLTPEELEIVINNYISGHRKYGIIAFSKAFNVEQYVIRKHLLKGGLISSI
jgi:hypothetical protein